jgi:acetamidase/formamidase
MNKELNAVDAKRSLALRGGFHRLDAVPENIHWGYFSRDLQPRLFINSGDIVVIEALSPVGHLYPKGLIDSQIRSVYTSVTDRGPASHMMTGPIGIKEAEPGDALEVRVLDLQPRHPFGIGLAAPGFILGSELGLETFGTVWAIDDVGTSAYAISWFRCTNWKLPQASITAKGRIAREQALRVPLRLHLGVAGVAPAESGRVSSIPPRSVGGNLDQWRFGVGTSMFYPIAVPHGLFSCGDGHLAQGDGEVAATGIETHLTATLQLILHKNYAVSAPLLVTPTHWVIHALADTLDEALQAATRDALDFLVKRGFERMAAYTFLSLAVDFGITQAVDQKVGVHAIIERERVSSMLPTENQASRTPRT